MSTKHITNRGASLPPFFPICMVHAHTARQTTHTTIYSFFFCHRCSVHSISFYRRTESNHYFLAHSSFARLFTHSASMQTWKFSFTRMQYSVGNFSKNPIHTIFSMFASILLLWLHRMFVLSVSFVFGFGISNPTTHTHTQHTQHTHALAVCQASRSHDSYTTTHHYHHSIALFASIVVVHRTHNNNTT